MVFILYAAMVLRVVGQFVPEVIFFSGAAGEYMYSFQSDNSPLTKLTFVNDIAYADETGMELSEEWPGILFYHRMKMTRSNFGPNQAQSSAGT